MPTAKALGRIGTAGGIVLIALFLSASHGSSQAGGREGAPRLIISS